MKDLNAHKKLQMSGTRPRTRFFWERQQITILRTAFQVLKTNNAQTGFLCQAWTRSTPRSFSAHPVISCNSQFLQTITARLLQGPRVFLFHEFIQPQLRWLRWDQVLVWIGPQEVTNQPCVWDIGRTHDALHLAGQWWANAWGRHVVKLRLPGEKNGKCRMFAPRIREQTVCNII